MAGCRAVTRPLAMQLQQQCAIRTFTTSQTARNPETVTSDASSSSSTPGPLDLDPNTVLPEFEQQLIRTGQMPIGSRRRRLAMRSAPNIPFEQLPYQAFQEARKILAADREEKLASLQTTVEKIQSLQLKDGKDVAGGDAKKQLRLASLQKQADRLKILADINDPLVKKRFEDGLGDMDKPIYRHLARQKWQSYDQRLITQRIEQFNIVPDILPKFEPTADVQLYFLQSKIAPGQIVDSLVSEKAPRLRVQAFDAGERLVTVVVLDADVPNLEENSFSKRCHYLAANIPLSPTQTSLPLSRIRAEDQLAVPWLPTFSQKGAPYHRVAVFLLEQQPGQQVDVAKLKELYTGREGFSLKSLRDKFALKPFGFNMFRSVWDENTAEVMARHSLPGADVEFRPTRVHSLKEPIKARGWEANRQGPKYRHLWKYTKRIKGISNARGWTKRR